MEGLISPKSLRGHYPTDQREENRQALDRFGSVVREIAHSTNVPDSLSSQRLAVHFRLQCHHDEAEVISAVVLTIVGCLRVPGSASCCLSRLSIPLLRFSALSHSESSRERHNMGRLR